VKNDAHRNNRPWMPKHLPEKSQFHQEHAESYNPKQAEIPAEGPDDKTVKPAAVCKEPLKASGLHRDY
jgi:hypothetical protein